MRRFSGVIALVLVGSCSQSLFEDEDKRNPASDASSTTIDARGSTDAGSADAQVEFPVCPAPCLGDALADFESNNKWSYWGDHDDRTWTEMSANEPSDNPHNLSGVQAGQAGIFSCALAANRSSAACEDFPTSLLLLPQEYGSPEPSLRYEANANGVIRVSGRYTPTAAGAVHALRVYRNSDEDLLFLESIDTTMTGASFDFDIEVLTGDALYFSVGPTEAGSPVPIALQLFLSEQTNTTFPGSCQMAVRFENGTNTTVQDECGTRTWEHLLGGGATTPTQTTSATANLGQAWEASSGQYWNPTTILPLDYTNEYTLQFWLKAASPVSGDVTVLSDDDLATSGISVSLTDAGQIHFLFRSAEQA
jgi:hypothetical protein